MISPVFTEQAVFNPPKGMEGWRNFRIEYGFEGDGLPEGSIWLPPYASWEAFEDLLQITCRGAHK
jgi:hypothetical protein